MYRFIADKKLYRWMNGRTPSQCIEEYCKLMESSGVNVGALPAFCKLTESWEFYGKGVKEHRYINSPMLINAFLDANVSIDNVTSIYMRFFHFEKGCFLIDGVEVLGAMFMALSGELILSASIRDKGKLDYLIYSLSDYDFKRGMDDTNYHCDVDKSKDSDSDICRGIAKVCFVSALYESTGSGIVKDGLWRNRFKHNGIAKVIEYPEPKRKVAWHFRQLRHERYYRGKNSNLEVGSRWVFVCPDEFKNSIKTVLN
ncbi:MAG: hypothetical protein AAGJ67_18105 [Pseudomonadota bacterium]